MRRPLDLPAPPAFALLALPLLALSLGGCEEPIAAPDAASPADDPASTAAMAGSMDLVEEPAKPLALIFLDGERVDTEGHDYQSVMRSFFPTGESISRIEVVMGHAGRKIYGPEARDGVILIWTKAYDAAHDDDHDAAHRTTHGTAHGTEHGTAHAATPIPEQPNR